MKIDANSIGNYTPLIKKPLPVEEKKVNTKSQDHKTINSKEKEFFSKLYPGEQNKISTHHFYMRNGNMAGVTVGSLFDRRG